jgi:AcrR family transcriptional regulator
LPAPTLTPVGHPGRIDIASIRREQIVEAAVGIIVRQGLPSLSLSKIERAARMKRGQLTYYFPTKEHILLAVFDRLLLLMYQRMEANDGPCEARAEKHSAWDCVQKLLEMVLRPQKDDELGPEFHALQYTFLAQIAHRDDFRKRLASLYEEWRSGLAAHWQSTARPATGISPRAVASFVQALVHGLLVQLAADPKAFDRSEMLALCVSVLAPLFVAQPHPRRNGASRPARRA